jgi:hypothetical protein
VCGIKNQSNFFPFQIPTFLGYSYFIILSENIKKIICNKKNTKFLKIRCKQATVDRKASLSRMPCPMLSVSAPASLSV